MDVPRIPLARPLAVLTAVVALVAGATGALAETPANLTGVPADPAPYISGMHQGAGPLIADAGDSAFVSGSDPVVLHGTSFGGGDDHAYLWSVDEGGGTLQVSDSPTAVIAGAEPGVWHTATLSVTDGGGATSTDTVEYYVDEPPLSKELVDEDVIHPLPGAVALGFIQRVPFSVDDTTGRLVADLSYGQTEGQTANDYELRLEREPGDVVASHNPPPGSPARVVVDAPGPGTWNVAIVKWTPFPDTAHVTVQGTDLGDHVEDPRPVVDAGGTYRFAIGDEQRLAGTVTGEDLTSTAWDLDLDGVFETDGSDVTADLPPGRHLVTYRAETSDGLEAREMTSVLVGTQEQLDELATPVTLIGFADSGINPYHLEFSAATYPDPEVLELTRNFTRHPSEYIPGYPEDAIALPITHGEGYFPEQDAHLWEPDPDSRFVKSGQVYWIPGTKIVGAIDAGGYSGSIHPILDDNGHGTGSASVAAGNRYGYCPTCLVVAADALAAGTTVITGLDWVDISSNSWGYNYGIPGAAISNGDEITKPAAERGQTILFSAGNGMGNTFFDVPILTYGSDYNGPDWVISVGAIREDSQGAIISDGVPAHVSNLGDGDLPSACRVGDTGQCAFGGTSAAAPYTAGVFGSVLTEARRALGDHSYPGQYDREGQVIAQGTPIEGSSFLDDGELTRQELRAAVLKTAEPRYEGEQSGDRFYPLPQTWDLDQASYVFEGYGSPGPAAAERALEVLLGLRGLPDRSDADTFFLEDCRNRDGLFGSYDRDGDETPDTCSEESEAVAFSGTGERSNDDPRDGAFDPARGAVAQAEAESATLEYWLHRRPVHSASGPPPSDDPTESGGPCAETHNEAYMDRVNSGGDVDTCFDDRITSTVAAYRPKGIFAAKDVLSAPLPAGSQVDVVAYMKSHEPSMTEVVAVLKATDREIGRSAAMTLPTSPVSWTEFDLGSFETLRPVAAGEQLSFHFVTVGARAYAYGYEDDHASRLTITPAAQPDDGLEFGVTIDDPADGSELDDGAGTISGQVAFPDLGSDPQLAGFHPVTHVVQVSVDDPDFRTATYAEVDREAGTYTAPIAGLADGEHTIYVRAVRDRFASPVSQIEVEVDGGDVKEPRERGNRPDEPPPGGREDQPGPPVDPPGRPDVETMTLGYSAERSWLTALAVFSLAVAASSVARTLVRRSG